MTSPTSQHRSAKMNIENNLQVGRSVAVSLIAFAIFLSGLTVPLARAQTFQVFHSFTGKSGGDSPYSGVSVDQAGNVYGTTFFGGFYPTAQCSGAGCGIAYKLTPQGQETVIHAFEGRSEGGRPIAGLLRDAQGNFYGSTTVGGDANCNPPFGCGMVFKIDAAGHETSLHQFSGGSDGVQPQGTLVQDAAGNLYGTTTGPFPGTGGTVFKIDPSGNETVLHAFGGPPDGDTPLAGLVIDAQSNLYGSTELGGTGTACGSFGCGIVYKIGPSGAYSVLYNFSGGADGSEASDTLALDSEGNLYGTTVFGGDLTCKEPSGCGVVFKIDSSGTESVLFTFTNRTATGDEPNGGVVRDASGNFYGTTYRGGAKGMGTVFKLDTAGNETLLHSFTGGADGAYPYAGLAIDAKGNLYGTTLGGGRTGCVFGQGCGVVFKITP